MRDGHLEVKEALRDWIVVGKYRDLEALHEFYGVPFVVTPWRPWHWVRDWWLRRAAKAKVRAWRKKTNHEAKMRATRAARVQKFNELGKALHEARRKQ